MRAIYFLIAAAVLLGVTACTNSDSVLEESSAFESVKDTYGIETVYSGLEGESDIPLVSLDDMRGVLEALRQGANQQKECVIEDLPGSDFGGSDAITRKVMMKEMCKVMTRNGAAQEDYILCVELKFSLDDGNIYYFGTDYSYTSDLFDWRAKGLSLSPVKNSDGYEYAFDTQSYLYFKIADQGNQLVKVPVVFNGSYNFKQGKGTYDFLLLKDVK
ncbi:DUF5033 domain-containing protein [Bacteroides fragilis]|mgnify:FL=1